MWLADEPLRRSATAYRVDVYGSMTGVLVMPTVGEMSPQGSSEDGTGGAEIDVPGLGARGLVERVEVVGLGGHDNQTAEHQRLSSRHCRPGPAPTTPARRGRALPLL